MSRQPTPSVFLQRAGYRQRRMRDGAKLVPFLGVILLAIPLGWPSQDAGEAPGSSRLLYIFGVWVVLIVLTAVFSARLRSDPASGDLDTPEE